VNNVTYNQSDTITFAYPSSNVYQIICFSSNSKPDVTLSLFDSNSSVSLGNSTNSGTTYTCDANQLCNVVYVVNFQMPPGSPFVSMTSLTCKATSTVPLVNLDTSISRKVVVNSLCKYYVNVSEINLVLFPFTYLIFIPLY
jgi:hypothetical protein